MGEKLNAPCVEAERKNESNLTCCIQDFLIHLKAAGRARSTVLSYQRDLEWLAGALGDIDVRQITRRHLESAVIKSANLSINGLNRSAVTMNRIKSAYRSFFKWARESERISYDPASSIHLARTESQRTVPITTEEIASLLCKIRSSDDAQAGRDEALFATYAFTGIRRAEALALRANHYDKITRTLHLPRTKNGNKRRQPVPSCLAEILEGYLADSMQPGRSDTCPLFPGRDPEQPLSVRQAQVRFDKWKNLSGIRSRLTIHSFRAGFATSLYRTTRDSLLVSRALGHSKVQTTIGYIDEDMLTIRDATERTFSK